MKKIRCPKCDEFVRFEESRIELGHSLLLHCDSCGKNFSVRFKNKEEKPVDYTYGHIVVVENVFCEKQIFPLKLGSSMFGRRSLGTEVDCPIQTGDMSMDRKHCIFHVEEGKDGEIIHRVEDYDSLVGTFVMNEILQKKEKRIIEEGEIITLGATTLILKKGKPD
jgi:hypothetical protein